MGCARLSDLPKPPADRRGWPWTEESSAAGFPARATSEWPRVTVITPSFNQAHYLEETIRSVLLQGYPNLEYLVLDGGSTDGSVEIIRKYAPWIDYWQSGRDGGQSAAINAGLERGSGVLATWINSDDMLCKDALVAQVSEMLANPDHLNGGDVFVGVCRYIDSNGDVIASHRGTVRTLEDIVNIKGVWRAQGQITQPEVLFPRQLALSVGALNGDNHFTMDYELWGKFLLAGARFHYTNVPAAMFRVHPDQKTFDTALTTRSLIEVATRLVEASPFPPAQKERMLQELRAYSDAYHENQWRGSGRLAKLGLPQNAVIHLRRLRKALQSIVR
jgi:glycosyltransferase involved in cell wall biosynthesis